MINLIPAELAPSEARRRRMGNKNKTDAELLSEKAKGYFNQGFN
jgi:hypothetical protein